MKPRSRITIPRLLLLALVTSSSMTNVGRARTLDRHAAIQTALAQNPQIAAARAEEAAAEAQTRQARAARMPFVTFDGGVGPALIATLVPGTVIQSKEEQYGSIKFADLSAVWIGNLAVIQPLYTFGKIALRGEAAAHGLRAREAQTRMQRADVAFAVAQLYEGYLLARDAERFFDEIDHWLDRTAEATEEKLAEGVGNVSERDLLRLQTADGLAAMGLNQARAAKAQAAAGVAAYLGLPPNEPITFKEDELLLAGSVPADVRELTRLAADHRPELTALREGQGALSALGGAEAAGRWPDLFVMGFVSAAYTPGRDWIQSRFVVDPLNHFVPGILLGVRWQLQGGMAPARAAEQEARGEVLGRTSDWAGAGIPAEVRKAYEDVLRAAKDVERGRDAVKKAKQWMVQASADYTAGFLDVRELSDAVEAYVTLRTAVMKGIFDHNVAITALAKATGVLDGDANLFYVDPRSGEGARGTP